MNITTHELKCKIGIVIAAYKFSPDYLDINYYGAIAKLDGMEMLTGQCKEIDLARDDIKSIHDARSAEVVPV